MLNKPAAFIKLTPLAKKYNKAERQTHCEAWKKSALSMSEYCRQSGLALSTFNKWLHRANPKKIIQPSSVKRAPITTDPSYAGIEIVLVSGLRVRFTQTMLTEAVKLIKALDSCS